MSSSNSTTQSTAAKAGEHPGARCLRGDRAVGAFAEPAHRRVAVDADDEGVAFPARGLEQLHVARVQEVEHAVGEDQAAGDRAAPGHGVGPGADLGGGRVDAHAGCRRRTAP